MDKAPIMLPPMEQSRLAAREGSIRNAGTKYEGMQIAIRQSRPFRIGDRSAHFDTLFGYFIDVINDPSRARRKDPDIHNRMRQDLQVYGCLKVRQLATAQLARTWVPASDTPDAKQVANRFAGWWDQQFRVTETLLNFLDAILDGISIQEPLWVLNEADYSYGIDRMFPCFKDRFVFSKDGRLCLKTRGNWFYGEQVHPWQFITHNYNISGGSWTSPTDEGRIYWGQGLEDNLYPTYFFKTVVLNFYTRWLQRLSGGVLIARYPWRNPEAEAAVLEVIEAYQEDEELAFPSGDDWSLEIKDGTRAPSDTYLAFLEYCDRQMSKAVLGSTLIIDQGGTGGLSLGKIHERTTFGRIAEFDRIGLEETINRGIVPVMGQLNQIPKVLWPSFRFAVDRGDNTAEIISALAGLQVLGFQITTELVTEKTGYRPPKPGETILHAAGDPLGGFDLLGGAMKPGPGGMTGLDLTTPQGLGRFRQIVYRGRDHLHGFQRYDLAASGGNKYGELHRHDAVLDKAGNGETDKLVGHGHEVRGWKCMPTGEHVHDILLRQQDLEQIVAALTAA